MVSDQQPGMVIHFQVISRHQGILPAPVYGNERNSAAQRIITLFGFTSQISTR